MNKKLYSQPIAKSEQESRSIYCSIFRLNYFPFSGVIILNITLMAATLFLLKQLHYFLGVEASWSKGGLFLSQTKYIHELLRKAHMSTANGVNTPACPKFKLQETLDDMFDDPTLYRSIVGGLQYLAITRPDIPFAVNKASQFMHSPNKDHWIAVKRILRYLKATANEGLFFQPAKTNDLVAYTDADWGGSISDRKSTSGFVIFHGPNLVSWSSRKQRTVARSTTDAEYRALATAASEVTWLQSLMRELELHPPAVPVIWCDNLSATYLAVNPVFYSHSKHLEIDFHFVRDKVAKKELKVCYIPSEDQIADVLTKPLSKPKFQFLKSKLPVLPRPAQLEGG